MFELLYAKRPYEKMPSEYIQYSENFYCLAWEALLHRISCQQSQEKPKDQGENGKHMKSGLSKESGMDSNTTSSSLQSFPTNLTYHFSSHPPSPVSLPSINVAGEETSLDCQNLLLRLLDVHLHLRPGGEQGRYEDFFCHPFFITNGISPDYEMENVQEDGTNTCAINIATCLSTLNSPIVPDFGRVNDFIFTKYFRWNCEENDLEKFRKQNDIHPSKEISEIVGKIYYHSPNFP